MVGETRDSVVAKIVADFVLTGHKIYTTSHTASAMTTPKRLFRLGIARDVLADRQFFSVMIFQRLLPVLCQSCKVPATDVLDEVMCGGTAAGRWRVLSHWDMDSGGSGGLRSVTTPGYGIQAAGSGQAVLCVKIYN